MKIHIIGPSGSGKTYLSQKLSEKTGIPCTSLDELFGDNSSAVSNTKRDPGERDQMLSSVLLQDNWIIEGVQHAWVGSSFEKADTIYLLEPPALLCRIRIIRRFVERKRTGTSRKNETFRSLLDLLKWTRKFYSVNLPEIHEKLQPYQNKVIRITNKKELRQMIQENVEFNNHG